MAHPLEIAIFVMLLAVAGLSAWRLWQANVHAEINGHLAVYGRHSQPTPYWAIVYANAVAAALATSAATLMSLHALHPSYYDRISRYYPTRARREHVTGYALLRCEVTPTYGVRGCRVTTETPPGYGFGESALKVAALMTLPEKDRPIARPGQQINLPIRFKLPDETGMRTRRGR